MELQSLVDRQQRALKIIEILQKSTQAMLKPMVNRITDVYGRDPFIVLVACLLSLRARDTFTFEICKQLFARAQTPHELLALSLSELEQLIYGINYYRTKASIIHSVSLEIINRFNGTVPQSKEALLSIKGVGPKTANLVLGHAFNIPAICVDIHVHRVSNRLALVNTKTSEETEKELERVIPRDKWIDINYLLVMWGQNICVPVSPFCSKCPLLPLCYQKGVTKHR